MKRKGISERRTTRQAPGCRPEGDGRRGYGRESLRASGRALRQHPARTASGLVPKRRRARSEKPRTYGPNVVTLLASISTPDPKPCLALVRATSEVFEAYS